MAVELLSIETVTMFLVVLFLLFVNAFFVTAEFAIVSVKPSKIREKAEKGSKTAKVALKIIEDIDYYLSSCQVGITLGSLGLGWLGEPYFEHLFAGLIEDFVTDVELKIIATIAATSVAFFLITWGHVAYGEMAPKSLAIRYSERLTLLTAYPLYVFTKLATPFIWFFNSTAMLLLRAFGIREPPTHLKPYSIEDIERILMQSRKQGVEIDTIFSRVFKYTKTKVVEIMQPRKKIAAIEEKATFDEIIEMANETGHSRFPVYRESLDNEVIGFIHIKDLIPYMNRKKEFSVVKILRKILFFPEWKPIDDVVRDMQAHKSQVGLVVDEFGTIIGLVTIEDCLEELVGEIQDEFDVEEPIQIKKIDDNRFELPGETPLDLFNETLGTELTAEDAVTVAGFILSKIMDFPSPNTTIDFSKEYGIIFHVIDVDGSRIVKLQAEKVTLAETDDEEKEKESFEELDSHKQH